MKRLKIAIVGFGRLGRACAENVRERDDLELVGVVVRSGEMPLADPFGRLPVARHPRDLPQRPQAALLCVPPLDAAGVGCELLQQRMPVVECAELEGQARRAHYDAIGEAAHRHRVAAVVGAGWNPGLLPLLRGAFEWLVPDGRTEERDRPAGASLHHTEAARLVPGVRDALATEQRDASGALARYVYVELAQGAKLTAVADAFRRDALFAGEATQVFEVDSVAALEHASNGVVLERLGTARSGTHQNLLLEARFDIASFAARVMLDAARGLEDLQPGLHRYALRP
jgi:diaminopimelate dehydrogenase